MKIGKYISELLFENDFVILPQVGEFSTKYIPAKFIPELKKVESPSKIITFNDKNKSGGGLLTEYIAQKENKTSIEAREFVNNFVTEMLNSLNAGKKVELENIGVFSMDSSGNILLDPDKSINYLNDSVGMTSVNEPAKKSEEDAKSELDKVLEGVSTGTAAREDAKPEIAQPEAEEKKPEEEKKEEQPVEKQPVETQPASATPAAKPPVVPIRPVQEPATRKTIAPREKEEAPVKNGGLPPAMKWVAFTVVPLLVVIIILAFNYEFIFGEKSVVWGKKSPAVPAQTESAAQQDDAAEPVAVPEVQADVFDPTVAPPAPERGRTVYYIVVGSFEEEHSAVILAEELRTKGARTANFFPANRQGFYRVYYGYYYDLREAERDLEIAKQINQDSWILHR
jgi:cell division septation protein DedD